MAAESLGQLKQELHKGKRSSSKQPSWQLLLPPKDHADAAATGATATRLSTGIGELDRVLGGGLVADSFVLLGGDPGIGKSTLILQVARSLEASLKSKILYVSGEESLEQIRMRALRLGLESNEQIFFGSETNLEQVFESVADIDPQVLIMDSLQTFSSQYSESPPGSVSQVREITSRLMTLAKTSGIAVILIGHVTKEGMIAGPKMVEHMVDTVLYFEGEGTQNYRLLRTVKNRFGSTRELGVFEMTQAGLVEVANPSSLFLNERTESVAGIAVTASLEGSRPLLVELQALLNSSPFPQPRRTSVGIEPNRIALFCAVIDKYIGLELGQLDLFFNVAGGLKLSETASDLGAIAAIWSSASDCALSHECFFVGEVGLTGEIRPVSMLEERIAEACKMGLKTIIGPPVIEKVDQPEAKMIGVRHIRDLPQVLREL